MKVSISPTYSKIPYGIHIIKQVFKINCWWLHLLPEKKLKKGGLGYFLMTCLYYIMTFDPSYKTKHGWMIKINICIFPSFNLFFLPKLIERYIFWFKKKIPKCSTVHDFTAKRLNFAFKGTWALTLHALIAKMVHCCLEQRNCILLPTTVLW